MKVIGYGNTSIPRLRRIVFESGAIKKHSVRTGLYEDESEEAAEHTYVDFVIHPIHPGSRVK
jgi:hypothetical protein